MARCRRGWPTPSLPPTANISAAISLCISGIIDQLSAHRDPHIGDRQWLAMSNPALNSLMQVSRAALDAAAGAGETESGQ